MAINIGENNDKEVTYVNSPDINRVLFKNLSEGASADDIADAVNAWIEEHPEAVTTVQDGSILPVKLDSSNEPSDGYVLSWNATAGKFEWIDIQSDITELKNDLTDMDGKIAATLITNTVSGSIASFPDGADSVPVKDLVAQIVPVQSGSGDPAPDNVRPISGWTGVNVHRTGKNLGNFTDIDAPKTENTAFSGFDLKGTAYVLSFDIVGATRESTGNTDVVRIHCADGSDVYGDLTNIKRVSDDVTLGNSTWPVTGRYYIKVAKTISWISFYWRSNSYLSLSAGACKNIMLESGTTATDYAPSNAETYSIDWTTEAGTVYGGTLDVTSGVLTVTHKSVTLDEDSEWTMYVEGKFYCNAITVAEASSTEAGAGYLCNQYLVAGNGNSASTHIVQDKRVYGQRQYGRFWVYDSAYSTLEAFQTALEANALQIVYPLTTPISIQLDSVTIATLLGQNNIWADCGDTTVDYRADTKLYIENLTAPTEDDMVANTNIPDATYFMVGNTLYLSTTTIPAGDTINPGTNCTKMSLAEALNAINS